MSVEYENFRWREREEGVWMREIDEVEAAYVSFQRQWRGSGRSFFHMTGHMSLQAPLHSNQDKQEIEREFDSAAAKAWTALRFHHPTIASHSELDVKAKKYVKVYRTNTDGWLKDTFHLISTGQTGIEWANNDPPCPPMPTINIIKPPSNDGQRVRRDIVLRSPHDVIDGIGTLLLFNNYVRLMAEAFEKKESYRPPSLDDPQVIRNLSPPFRVAAAIPPQPSAKTLQRLSDLTMAEQADRLRNAEVVALPYKKGAVAPGIHKRVEFILSAEETSTLTAACKGIHATVTHVFHTAIALVLRDLQTRSAAPRPVEYVGYLLRNERPNCKPPYNDHRHAATAYHSVSGDKLIIGMVVPGAEEGSGNKVNAEDERAEFLRIVDEMKRFYCKVRDDPDHSYLAPLLWAKGASPLPTELVEVHSTTPVPPPAEVASVTISSMGRVDNMITPKHGNIEVFHPWVTGEELRNSLGLFLGTFRGELSLSAAYNTAWHNEEDAVIFVRRCVEVVQRGLGIPMCHSHGKPGSH